MVTALCQCGQQPSVTDASRVATVDDHSPINQGIYNIRVEVPGSPRNIELSIASKKVARDWKLSTDPRLWRPGFAQWVTNYPTLQPPGVG